MPEWKPHFTKICAAKLITKN